MIEEMIEKKRKGTWLYVKMIIGYLCLASWITALFLWLRGNSILPMGG